MRLFGICSTTAMKSVAAGAAVSVLAHDGGSFVSQHTEQER
jgi:hypothetical protein